MIRFIAALILCILASHGARAQTTFAPQPLVYPNCTQMGTGTYCSQNYGVKCDGATDDTVAINAMLTALAAGTGQPTTPPAAGIRSAWNEAFLQAGTCIVSGTLTLGSNENTAKRAVLRGFGKGVTIIKLADGSPLFQNPYHPTPVFSYCWTSTSPCGADVSAFMAMLHDLTINTGYSNPGATGLQMLVNNVGGGAHLSIVSPGYSGGCGLDLTPSFNGPETYDDVTVVGFTTGVCMSSAQYYTTFRDLTLIGQTGAGMFAANGYNFSVDGLKSINTIPAISLIYNGYAGVANFDVESPSLTANPAFYANTLSAKSNIANPIATLTNGAISGTVLSFDSQSGIGVVAINQVVIDAGNVVPGTLILQKINDTNWVVNISQNVAAETMETIAGTSSSALHLNNGTVGANYPPTSQIATGVSVGAGQYQCAIVTTAPTNVTTYNPNCTYWPTQYVRENAPPNDPINQWVSTNGVITTTALQTALNTCVGSPGSGTTVYLNNEGASIDYPVDSTLTIPSCVNRFIGLGARIYVSSLFSANACMLNVAARSTLLIIEDFENPTITGPNQYTSVCNPTGAPVLMRDILMTNTNVNYSATGSTTSNSNGYMIDVANGQIITTGQNIYGWGVDSESNRTHVINNGAFVQIVGHKQEQASVLAQTNCGTTIILGTFTIQNQLWPQSMPVYDLTCGSLYADYTFASNYPANRGSQIPYIAVGNSTTGATLAYLAKNGTTPLGPIGWYSIGNAFTATLPATQTYIDVGNNIALGGGDGNHVITVGP